MNNEVLRKIQMDIRNNFENAVDWSSIPRGDFNCFMFAVLNTIPTEILHHVQDGINYLDSLLDENVLYFANIGQISGQTNYTNISELIEALKGDLDTLGILAQESSLTETVTNGCIKIAFYYDTESLLKGKHMNFHFIRQEGEVWVHKEGWAGDIKQLDYPIEEFSADRLELIGYFQLSLKDSLS